MSEFIDRLADIIAEEINPDHNGEISRENALHVARAVVKAMRPNIVKWPPSAARSEGDGGMSDYTHAAYSMGCTVEPDLKSYYPATLSRWRLFLAAVGLKKLPDLYRAVDYDAAIKRARETMVAYMLKHPFDAEYSSPSEDAQGVAGLANQNQNSFADRGGYQGPNPDSC